MQKLKMVDNKAKILPEIESFDLDDNFYLHCNKQRMLYSKVNDGSCGSEYMSLFYHIRNSLAHGRFAMYLTKNNDVVFVMEDGKRIGEEVEDKFEVSARIVINKSSLLRIIDVLKNPPIENDYSDDIIDAIKNGKYTKEKIMDELEIDENTYKKFIYKLKDEGLIKYEHKKWAIVQ